MTCVLTPFVFQLLRKYDDVLADREIMIKGHPEIPSDTIRTCRVTISGDYFAMAIMFKEGKGYAAAIATDGIIGGGPNEASHPFDWSMSSGQYAVKFDERWIDLSLFFLHLIKSGMPLTQPARDVIDRVSGTTLAPFEPPFVMDPIRHPDCVDATMFDALEQTVAVYLLPVLAKTIVSWIATRL